MRLFRAGQAGETTVGYSFFFASTRAHAETYQRYSDAELLLDHRDRSTLYHADVMVDLARVKDLTPLRRVLYRDLRVGPDVMLDYLGAVNDQVEWLAYPDWNGIAWVYVGQGSITLQVC